MGENNTNSIMKAHNDLKNVAVEKPNMFTGDSDLIVCLVLCMAFCAHYFFS